MEKQILTKTALKKLIKEEVEKQINENIFVDAINFIRDNPESLAFFGPMIAGAAVTVKATIDKLNQFAADNVKGSKMELVKKAIQAAAGEGVRGIEKATGADTMGQGLGGFKP